MPLYPIEPHDFRFMSCQLKRWSHGFAQNVRLHWRGVLEVPYLRSAVAVAVWDAVIASLAYLLLLPLAAMARLTVLGSAITLSFVMGCLILLRMFARRPAQPIRCALIR